MTPIITVFLVDTATSLQVIVQRNETTISTGPDLLQLTISEDAQGAHLAANSIQPLAFDDTVPNKLELKPGVYFFATDTRIKYSIVSGSCRVAFNSGKDPWPPPPPPAPQGTDLEKHETVYNAMFSDIVTSVGHPSGKQWFVASVEEELEPA